MVRSEWHRRDTVAGWPIYAHYSVARYPLIPNVETVEQSLLRDGRCQSVTTDRVIMASTCPG